MCRRLERQGCTSILVAAYEKALNGNEAQRECVQVLVRAVASVRTLPTSFAAALLLHHRDG